MITSLATPFTRVQRVPPVPFCGKSAPIALSKVLPNNYPTISNPCTVFVSYFIITNLFHVIATQIYTTYTADYTLTVRI